MTHRMAGIWLLVLAGLGLLVGACGRDAPVSGEGLLVERRPNLAYEELFPRYVELCVTSQYRSKTKGRGGPAGLHESQWLPTRHGALLKTLPVHQPNDLFDPTFRLFALESPFTRGKRAAALRLLSDERFVDLGANLRYFRGRYDAILTERYADFDGLASVRGTPFRRMERLHYDYIRAQRDEVDEMLDRLATLTD